MIEQIRPELTWRLRRDTLYPGLELTEMEMPEDTHGIHFGAFRDNKLAGVVSLFQKGTDFQFRKLAVDQAIQRKGIGSALLQYVTAFAAGNGGTRIWCNARVSAVEFYLKAGFCPTGVSFLKNDVGYEIMEKPLIPTTDTVI